MGDERELNSEEGAEPGAVGSRPFFSIFKKPPKPSPAAPKPKPAAVPQPAAKPQPAAVPQPAAKPEASAKPVTPQLEERLAALEKKLFENAQKASENEMLSYLKERVSVLEDKLRESQERSVSFACELKGREEARKESHREMEELLAAVRRNQAEAEAERARLVEREMARERIEVLETKLLEVTAAAPQREDQLSARIDQLATAISALDEKIKSAADFSAAEAVARQRGEADMVSLASSIDAIAAAVAAMQRKNTESVISERLDKLATELTELRNRPTGATGPELAALLLQVASKVRHGGPGEYLSQPRPLEDAAEQVRSIIGASSAAEVRQYASAYETGSLKSGVQKLEAAIATVVACSLGVRTTFSGSLTAEEKEGRLRGNLMELDKALEGLDAAMRFYRMLLIESAGPQK